MANEDSTFSAADWKSADSKQRKILMAERAKAQEERQKKEVQELTAQQKRIKELKANMALREKWDVQLSKTQDEMLLKQREMEQQLKRELNQKEIYAIKTEQALKFEARAIEQKDALKDVTKKLLEFQQKQLFLDTKEAKQQADSIRAKEHQLKVQEDLAAGIEDIKKAEQELAFSRSAEGKLQVKNQARAAKIREQIQKEQEERGALVKELKGSVKEYFDVFTSAIPKPAMILGKMGLRGIKGIGRGLLGAGRGIGGMLGFGKKKGAQATEKAEKKKEDRQETQLGLQQDQAANIEKLTEHMTGEAATKDGEEGESWFGKIKGIFTKFGPMILTTLGTIGTALATGFVSMASGAASLLAPILGPAVLLAGIAWMIYDAITGYTKSEEWGTSKTSSVIGAALGGTKQGWMGAFTGGLKWAAVGAGIGWLAGSFFPGVGNAIGALIGGIAGMAIGAILGYIGGKRIAKAFDSVGNWLYDQWDAATEAIKEAFIPILDFMKRAKNFVLDLLPAPAKAVLRKMGLWEDTPRAAPTPEEQKKIDAKAAVERQVWKKESAPKWEAQSEWYAQAAEDPRFKDIFENLSDRGRRALEKGRESVAMGELKQAAGKAEGGWGTESAAQMELLRDLMTRTKEGETGLFAKESTEKVAENVEATKSTDASVQTGLGLHTPPFLSWMPDIAKNIAAMASAIGVAGVLGVGGGDPASAGKTSGTEPSKAPTAVSSTKSPAATKAPSGAVSEKSLGMLKRHEGGFGYQSAAGTRIGGKKGAGTAEEIGGEQRFYAYLDSKKIPTIGYGFNLQRGNEEKVNKTLSAAGIPFTVNEFVTGVTKDGSVPYVTGKQAESLLLEDYKSHQKEAEKYLGKEDFAKMPQQIQEVLTNMAFNMGGKTLGKFSNFRKLLKAGKFKEASKEMLAGSKKGTDSKWYKDVGVRAEELSAIVAGADSSIVEPAGSKANMGKALTQTEADLDAAKAQGKGTQAPPVMNTTVVNNNTGGNTTQIGSRTVRNARSSGNNTTVGHGAS